MKTKLIFLSVLSALFTSAAHAGIYLEPYLGYGMGSDKSTLDMGSGDNDVDAKSKGMVYGGKLGWNIALVAFGLDYMATNTSGDFTVTPGTLAGTMDAKSTNIGAFVNVALPMVHFYGTYFVSSKVSGTANFTGGGTPLTHDLTGSGFKIGGGFTGLPIVAINLDLIMLTHTKGSYSQGGPTADYASISSKTNLTMLSVSAPFSF